MPRRFPGFSFKQHQLTGQQIYNARQFFGELLNNLANSYGGLRIFDISDLARPTPAGFSKAGKAG